MLLVMFVQLAGWPLSIHLVFENFTIGRYAQNLQPNSFTPVMLTSTIDHTIFSDLFPGWEL